VIISNYKAALTNLNFTSHPHQALHSRTVQINLIYFAVLSMDHRHLRMFDGLHTGTLDFTNRCYFAQSS
jgi:hypothetical protein